jgi:hypothetical protein
MAADFDCELHCPGNATYPARCEAIGSGDGVGIHYLRDLGTDHERCTFFGSLNGAHLKGYFNCHGQATEKLWWATREE